MSPEQALGGRVDARTDIFSLGVIVYEMVTGTNPFHGETPARTILNIIQKTPSPPTSINSDLPKMFDVVLLRALAKDLDKRTESAAKLAADLRRCRGLLEANAELPSLPAPNVAERRQQPDILPIEEERGGSGLWWLLAGLGAAMAAAIYFWIK
jgi:serine/threonine-protein kinase